MRVRRNRLVALVLLPSVVGCSVRVSLPPEVPARRAANPVDATAVVSAIRTDTSRLSVAWAIPSESADRQTVKNLLRESGMFRGVRDSAPPDVRVVTLAYETTPTFNGHPAAAALKAVVISLTFLLAAPFLHFVQDYRESGSVLITRWDGQTVRVQSTITASVSRGIFGLENTSNAFVVAHRRLIEELTSQVVSNGAFLTP